MLINSFPYKAAIFFVQYISPDILVLNFHLFCVWTERDEARA